MKPNIFIGSSTENLDVANAIQANLEYDSYCHIWSQGTFDLSESNLDSLLNSLEEFDFAIFILYPDDLVQMRDSKLNVARDNVIFELGLFFGKLGREKVYYIMPRTESKMHLPSDLLGITSGTYDPNHPNLRASLEPFCQKVRNKIRKEFLPHFPKNGSYGENILYSGNDILKSETPYSLQAITPNNFPLKIKIKNMSEKIKNPQWFFLVAQVNHWDTITYDQSSHEQLFTLSPKTTGALKLEFTGEGKGLIEFYKGPEADPFLQKTFSWS